MKNHEIHLRDPFVLTHGGKYYLYGTRGATGWGDADGFDVFIGDDLENWEGPFEIFHNDGTFWADKHYWAPEVHEYRGDFYLFASFKKDGVCRGTQVLKAKSPVGPFLPHSDGPVTPRAWDCLDGTLYISKTQKPYMVFCHEWSQVKDGKMCAVALSDDLKTAAGKPFLLFKASEQPNVQPYDGDGYITDGPFLHRLKNGKLLMIWSTKGVQGYCVAAATSDNEEIDGKWTLSKDLIFEKDGGHGMIFTALDNQLYITLHAPNETPKERPCFYKLGETENSLRLL